MTERGPIPPIHIAKRGLSWEWELSLDKSYLRAKQADMDKLAARLEALEARIRAVVGEETAGTAAEPDGVVVRHIGIDELEAWLKAIEEKNPPAASESKEGARVWTEDDLKVVPFFTPPSYAAPELSPTAEKKIPLVTCASDLCNDQPWFLLRRLYYGLQYAGASDAEEATPIEDDEAADAPDPGDSDSKESDTSPWMSEKEMEHYTRAVNALERLGSGDNETLKTALEAIVDDMRAFPKDKYESVEEALEEAESLIAKTERTILK